MRERIFNDINNALKAGAKKEVQVLRMLKSAILELEREKKENLNDDDVLGVINKQLKTRRESLEQFQQAERNDLVEAVETEIAILSKYLPVQLTEEELNKIIEDVFDELKPNSSRDIGQIMASIIPKVKGRTDMGLVSEKIKMKLGN